jgi:hypothetical protein
MAEGLHPAIVCYPQYSMEVREKLHRIGDGEEVLLSWKKEVEASQDRPTERSPIEPNF